jgi:dihydroorotate dehydrogenase
MPGGLSGAPLLAGTLAAISRARQLAGGRLAIIATGGISSAADVRSVRHAGADLVQLWTGLIYRGPGLIGEAVHAAATIETA